jgi:hypothetical protein
VGHDEDGISCLSIADPAHPRPLPGFWASGPTAIKQLLVRRGLAYASTPGALKVIAIKRGGRRLRQIASVELPEEGFHHMIVEGDRLHGAASRTGVVTLDLSAPRRPRLVRVLRLSAPRHLHLDPWYPGHALASSDLDGVAHVALHPRLYGRELRRPPAVLRRGTR